MTWQDLLTALGGTLAALGGTTVICLGVGKWFADRLADRLKTEWTFKHNRDLEELKSMHSIELERIRAELAENREMIASARAAISTGYAGAQSRVLEAVDSMWRKILVMRVSSSRLLFPYLVFAPEEIEAPAFAEKLSEMVPLISDKQLQQTLDEVTEAAEDTRPFLGESLWRSFSLYRSFTLRLAFKMQQQRRQGHYLAWNKDWKGRVDNELLEMPKLILGDGQLQQVLSMGPLGVPQRILEAMETKILEEMNELIFGRRLVSLTIEEQERVRRVLSTK